MTVHGTSLAWVIFSFKGTASGWKDIFKQIKSKYTFQNGVLSIISIFVKFSLNYSY